MSDHLRHGPSSTFRIPYVEEDSTVLLMLNFGNYSGFSVQVSGQPREYCRGVLRRATKHTAWGLVARCELIKGRPGMTVRTGKLDT